MLKAIHLYINIVSFRGQLPRYLGNTRRCGLRHSPNNAPGSSRDKMAALATLRAVWQAETWLKDTDTEKTCEQLRVQEKKKNKHQDNKKSLWQSAVTISHVPASQLCHELREQRLSSRAYFLRQLKWLCHILRANSYALHFGKRDGKPNATGAFFSFNVSSKPMTLGARA